MKHAMYCTRILQALFSIAHFEITVSMLWTSGRNFVCTSQSNSFGTGILGMFLYSSNGCDESFIYRFESIVVL